MILNFKKLDIFKFIWYLSFKAYFLFIFTFPLNPCRFGSYNFADFAKEFADFQAHFHEEHSQKQIRDLVVKGRVKARPPRRKEVDLDKETIMLLTKPQKQKVETMVFDETGIYLANIYAKHVSIARNLRYYA